ncbi:MAG: phosphoribosyltransferase [bacterium]|nr:phosphoribosyltransferase [bacterium]
MDTEKQKYTWQEFDEDVNLLAEKIKATNKKFDGIYGIPRGGLPIAVALSHRLDLPMLMGGANEKTLVVDDIADSGSTLKPYRDRKSTIVTVFYHPSSTTEPNIWLRNKEQKWIVFPWES